MNSFWKLFLHAIPLGLGTVLCLVSIAYTTKVVGHASPGDEIVAAILFGIIGFPMVVASAIKFAKRFNQG